MSAPVTPTQQSPTHHVSLTDGTTVLSFVLADAKGNRDETAFRRYPLKPDAMRIQQGESKYSDNESPYASIAQDDWSGGRGSLRFEDDRTRYTDAEGVDTLNAGSIVLGPRVRYGVGYRNEVTNDSSVRIWHTLLGAQRALAVSFVPSASFTIAKVRFHEKHFGSPGDLTVGIYTNSAGVPGSLVGSGNTVSLVSDGGTLGSNSYFREVTVSAAVTSGATYWLVFYSAATDDADNYVQVIGTSTGSGKKDSGSDWTWPAWTGGILYRLTETNAPFIARFFDYKGQMYFFKDYDAKDSDSELWMNGWRGACDDNSANLSRLYDATQDFSGASFDAKIARIVAGLGSTEWQDFRPISSGSNGYVTVDKPWNIQHSVTDDYVLLGSDRFQLIAAPPEFAGHVTDVEVDNGIVYMAMGNSANMWKHREWNNNGTWCPLKEHPMYFIEEFDTWHWIEGVARFLKIQHDPVLGSTMWQSCEPGYKGGYRQEIRKSSVPLGWDGSPLGTVVVHDFTSDWDEQDVSYVTRTFDAAQKVIRFRVTSGTVTGVNATPITAGTGYTEGDVLTLKEWTAEPPNYLSGAGLNATVTVVSVGGSGEITEVSLTAAGFDYSTGTKDVSGGTGESAQIQISSVASFTTGILGSKVVPARGAGSYIDLRHVTILNAIFQSTINLDAGDIQLLIDNNALCSSPILTLDFPSIRANDISGMNFAFDPDLYSGLDKVISVGIQVAVAKQTFDIDLLYGVRGYVVYEPIPVGGAGETITGLELWGDPENLWVLTDANMYEVRSGIPIPAHLREIGAVKSINNGRAHTVNDVYLYFSLKDGFERYYQGNLEDIGPNKDAGLGMKRGPIVCATTYPGRVIVGTDGSLGSSARWSRVLAFKGHAWHEMWTTDLTRERIRSVFIQTVPGYSERLWVSTGDDVAWMPLELGTDNLPSDTTYEFTHEGWIETAWIYTAKQDLKKVFKSITVFNESCVAGQAEIDVFYIIDNEGDTWYEAGTITTRPSQELSLASSGFVTGKRLKFRFRLRSISTAITPVLKAWVLKFYAIDTLKYGYTWLTKLTEGDLSIDLQGDEEKTWGTYNNVEDALAKLDAWVAATTPLTMSTVFSPMDSRDVICKAAPVRTLRVLPDEQIEIEAVQITAEEL